MPTTIIISEPLWQRSSLIETRDEFAALKIYNFVYIKQSNKLQYNNGIAIECDQWEWTEIY